MGAIWWRREWVAPAPTLSTAGHVQSDVGRAEDRRVEEGIGGEGRRSEGQEKVKKCYTYIVI